MKKVIIIGATSGIGYELARLYAKEKFRVGVTGRRTELLLALQSEFPAEIFIETFDVTGENNIHHFEKLINELGGLDILVYNSGFAETSKELSWQIDKATVFTNVNGFVEMVNYGFNYFLKQGHGQIAGISSIASGYGNSWAPAYSASKAFMSTYLQGLEIKLFKMHQQHIFITDIQPGFVRTKMAKGNKQFWVASVHKATLQIFNAINKKKRRAYITRRWWLVAKLMKILPHAILKRVM